MEGSSPGPVVLLLRACSSIESTIPEPAALAALLAEKPRSGSDGGISSRGIARGVKDILPESRPYKR